MKVNSLALLDVQFYFTVWLHNYHEHTISAPRLFSFLACSSCNTEKLGVVLG